MRFSLVESLKSADVICKAYPLSVRLGGLCCSFLACYFFLFNYSDGDVVFHGGIEFSVSDVFTVSLSSAP